MKKILFPGLFMAILATGSLFASGSNHKAANSDGIIANINAIDPDEMVEVVGCKYRKNATCYVISDGQILDKRKNQYP